MNIHWSHAGDRLAVIYEGVLLQDTTGESQYRPIEPFMREPKLLLQDLSYMQFFEVLAGESVCVALGRNKNRIHKRCLISIFDLWGCARVSNT